MNRVAEHLVALSLVAAVASGAKACTKNAVKAGAKEGESLVPAISRTTDDVAIGRRHHEYTGEGQRAFDRKRFELRLTPPGQAHGTADDWTAYQRGAVQGSIHATRDREDKNDSRRGQP